MYGKLILHFSLPSNLIDWKQHTRRKKLCSDVIIVIIIITICDTGRVTAVTIIIIL